MRVPHAIKVPGLDCHQGTAERPRRGDSRGPGRAARSLEPRRRRPRPAPRRRVPAGPGAESQGEARHRVCRLRTAAHPEGAEGPRGPRAQRSHDSFASGGVSVTGASSTVFRVRALGSVALQRSSRLLSHSQARGDPSEQAHSGRPDCSCGTAVHSIHAPNTNDGETGNPLSSRRTPSVPSDVRRSEEMAGSRGRQRKGLSESQHLNTREAPARCGDRREAQTWPGPLPPPAPEGGNLNRPLLSPVFRRLCVRVAHFRQPGLSNAGRL